MQLVTRKRHNADTVLRALRQSCRISGWSDAAIDWCYVGLMEGTMTTALAKELRLDLFGFTTGERATAFARGSKERRAVAVFEEEHAHFYVFWVACRPTPKIKKFHERIAQ